MTLLLLVNPASAPTHLVPFGPLRTTIDALVAAYYPLLILAFLGAILWMENQGAHNTGEPQAKTAR